MKRTLVTRIKHALCPTRETVPSGLARLDSEFAQRLGEALQRDVTKSAALSYANACNHALVELGHDLRRAFDDNDIDGVAQQLSAARKLLHQAIRELRE